MKVFIAANNSGGLYNFRKELIEEILKDNKVFLSVPNGDEIKEFRSMGCKYIPCEIERRGKNPVNDIKLLRYYIVFLKKIKPDIVFTYTIKPNVYCGLACSILKIPYVVNITGLGTAVENEGMLQKITLLLYKVGVKKAQKVFFQNKSNEEFMIRKGIIRGKYDLLPGSGVNLEKYALLEYPNEKIIHFSFISRIMQEKGIDQYLEAASYIRKKFPYTRFHVCGECEENYKDKLEEMQKNNIIIYHGVVKDIREIHKISSCTIHPTYYPEGMSNVLLESCACGRPIITTNRAGCREIIDDNVNGYIVKEKNSKDLISKIEKFIALSFEEKQKMGLEARKKVEKEFDRNIVIQKYLSELNS